MIRWVLPTLAVDDSMPFEGNEPSCLYKALLAKDRIIDQRGVAVVPNDDTAAEVMRLLGLDEAEIQDRLSVSHGGPTIIQ